MFEVLASIGSIAVYGAATACLASIFAIIVKVLWEYLKYYLAKKYRFSLGKRPEPSNTFAVGDMVRLADTSALIYPVLGVSEDYILIRDEDGRNRWFNRRLFQPYVAEDSNLENLGQEYEEILNCQEAWENTLHGTHDRS